MTDTAPHAIELRSAVALLGRFPALAGLDLIASAGDTVLLQGPNGAGKTTLLRVCAGLVPVVDGDAFVLGCNIRKSSAFRTRVGMVGHASGLYADLSAVENAEFFAKANGLDAQAGRDALHRMGVSERLHHLAVHSLSAGQRKRVSFAAMLARRPEVWLLDEPHSGLDEAGRDHLDALIIEAASAGATIVMASHELDRAGEIAARTVEIVGGVAK